MNVEAVTAHIHHELHNIDWENTIVPNYDEDFIQEESQRSSVN